MKQSSSKGGKRAARNAKLREFYSDPLPIPTPPPSFNIFSPSTYKSLIFPPSQPRPYIGRWCAETRSVNISSDADGVEIWRRGMWGKGTLSRSQPAWRERKVKEMTGSRGNEFSLEEITARKRQRRAEFKEARLKNERLERERQLREEGKLSTDTQVEGQLEETAIVKNQNAKSNAETADEKPKIKGWKINQPNQDNEERPAYTEEYLDKEILQFAPEEALFLMQLDLLIITHNDNPLSLREFLHLIATPHSDDPFLVHYIVYYHFRRRQVIVKPGLKFGVDYLLYDSPIPLVHASHCVNVLGSYHLWTPDHKKLVRDTITWQEINLWQRLMGNVRKRLKLVYVEIPPPEGDWRDVDTQTDFKKVLQRYKIREVMNSRFVIARQRDVKADK